MGPFIAYGLSINYVSSLYMPRSRPRCILRETKIPAAIDDYERHHEFKRSNLNHKLLHTDSSTCTLESGAHHPAHNVPQITGN